MSKTKEKLLDIFYFETNKDITFYSTTNNTKLTLIKNLFTFNQFQKIKDKYNFISLVWESQEFWGLVPHSIK